MTADSSARFTELREMAAKSLEATRAVCIPTTPAQRRLQRLAELARKIENFCPVCDDGRLLHPTESCRKCLRLGED